MDIILKYLVDNVPALLTAIVSIGAVSVILSKVVSVIREITELLTAIVVALGDGKLTKGEVDTIIKEAKDIPPTIKLLLKK